MVYGRMKENSVFTPPPPSALPIAFATRLGYV